MGAALLPVIHKTCYSLSLVLTCCLCLFCILTARAAIDCNNYEVKELKKICSNNKAPVTEHNDLSSTGLNAEVDNWRSNPGLHILPPKTYVLNKPIKLKSGQIILPHPTSALPAGKKSRTIELTPGDIFALESSSLFYVLQLDNQTSAGGVEINGYSMNQPLADYEGTKTLVYSPANLGVVFSGSVLRGDHNLDYLFWNDASTGDYWARESKNGFTRDTTAGLRISRNYFETKGASIAVFVTGGHHPPTLRNNAVFINTEANKNDISIGIQIDKGSAQLLNNDFIFDQNPSGQNRIGVYASNVSAAAVLFNAFYSQNTDSHSDQSTGVFIDSASEFLSISDNSFSPLVTPISGKSDNASPEVVQNELISNPLNSHYPLDSPRKFFRNINDLGTTPIPTALLLDGLGNHTNYTNLQTLTNQQQLANYDTSMTLNSILNDLIARAGYCESCPHTINTVDIIGNTIVCVAGLTSVALFGGWGGFVAGSHRPCLFCR